MVNYDHPKQLGERNKKFKSVTMLTSEHKSWSGWVLKKGRYKMQGYAHRYLIVESSGQLAYFKTPGG
jgi:hypothetical protein